MAGLTGMMLLSMLAPEYGRTQQTPEIAAAQQAAPPTHPGPTVALEGVSSMRLVPGSMVDIHIFEEPDLDGSYRLDKDGAISLPLAGEIHLEGLSLRQAEATISASLVARQILRTSHVVVNLNEYAVQNIVVSGEVALPGRYPALVPRKLVDVLAMAGGRSVRAGGEVQIHRSDSRAQVFETVKCHWDAGNFVDADVLVYPGDTVQVTRAGIVYVLGAVNRPGGYVMQESGSLNVAQALALASGTTLVAAVGSIRIVRKTPSGTIVVIPALYSRTNKGEVPPSPLKAEDIVYVPTSKLKAALLNSQGILGSATSATIYGVR